MPEVTLPPASLLVGFQMNPADPFRPNVVFTILAENETISAEMPYDKARKLAADLSCELMMLGLARDEDTASTTASAPLWRRLKWAVGRMLLR